MIVIRKFNHHNLRVFLLIYFLSIVTRRFAIPSAVSSKALIPFKPPANITGPNVLRALSNRCFTLAEREYDYRFCPFQNVTQHERVNYWSRYEGILGIWSGEWIIHNNTFIAMKYDSGSLCSAKSSHLRRKITVYTICGPIISMNVTEPEVCRYEMYFATPLLCESQTLKVYPTLSDHSKYRWNLLETLRSNNLITERVYNFQLSQLFKEAGLIKRNIDQTKNESNPKVNFNTLEECRRAYSSLLVASKVAKTSATEDNELAHSIMN